MFLSLVFALIFHFWINFFVDAKAEEQKFSEEVSTIKSAPKSKIVAHIWTAVSLNLWIKHKLTNSTEIKHLSDIYEIEYILSNNKVARNSLIRDNMLALNAYRNNIKLDIKKELALSSNKAETLEFIINKFEYNLENAERNLQTLRRQNKILFSARKKAINDSLRIKKELENEFKTWNPTASLEYMEAYIEAKNREDYANTYIILINEIISKYESLNTINKELTKVIKQNKDPIIKWTTLVIPDTWKKYLLELDLLFSESK